MPHRNHQPAAGAKDPHIKMDFLETEVLKPNGSIITVRLSHKESVVEVLQALAEGGYVVLKDATKISSLTSQEDVESNQVRQASVYFDIR